MCSEEESRTFSAVVFRREKSIFNINYKQTKALQRESKMLYFPSDFSSGTSTVIRDLFATFGTCTLKKTALVLGLCMA